VLVLRRNRRFVRHWGTPRFALQLSCWPNELHTHCHGQGDGLLVRLRSMSALCGTCQTPLSIA
jgi:hypothetical protein